MLTSHSSILGKRNAGRNPPDTIMRAGVVSFTLAVLSLVAANLLSILAVNGSPTFTILDLGPFDSAGQRAFSGTVPVGLSGLTVDFMSLGFHLTGKIGLSNVETVGFL